MNSFGNIKTKIEKVLTENYGKPSFKTYLQGFKKHILNNKQLSEAYYIYDDLSSQKGIDTSIVDEYISESFDHLKNIIDSNQKKIDELNEWINEILKEEVNNEYRDIDLQIYTKNVVKNLESLLESKKRIKSRLLETKVVEENKSFDIPLSSMVKIMTNSFNKEYSTLNEQEKIELKSYTHLNKKSLSEEIEKVKEEVLLKLENTLTSTDDDSLKTKLNETIQSVSNTKKTPFYLYKLKKLNEGL